MRASPRHTAGGAPMGALTMMAAVMAMVLGTCHGLYKDQLGQGDWLLEKVGSPRAVAYSAKKLFVATEAGVLAALNSRTGDIEWRRLLGATRAEGEGGEEGAVEMDVVQVNSHSRVVTAHAGGAAGPIVRLWRASDGALLWDNVPLTGGGDALGPISLAVTERYAVLAALGSVSFFDLASGALKWHVTEFELRDGVDDKCGAHFTTVMALPNGVTALGWDAAAGSLASVTLDVASEKVASGKAVKVKGAGAAGSVVFGRTQGGESAGPAEPIALHLDAKAQGIVVANLATSKVETVSLTALTGLGASDPALASKAVGEVEILANSDRTLFTVRTEGGDGKAHTFAVQQQQQGGEALQLVASGAGSGAAGAFTSKNDASNKVMAVLEVNSAGSFTARFQGTTTSSAATTLEFPVRGIDVAQVGHPRAVFPYLVALKDGATGYRVVVVTTGDVVLNYAFEKKEALTWSRDEAMTRVKHIEFVDRRKPSSSSDVSRSGVRLPTWQERLEMQKQDALSMVHDLQTKLQTAASDAPSDLLSLLGLQRDSSHGKDGFSQTMRHKFGLDKVAVVLTAGGRLVALALDSGETLWSLMLDHSDYRMVPLRRRQVGSLHPEVALVRYDADAVTTHVKVVDGFEGTVEAVHGGSGLPVTLSSIIPLHVHDDTYRPVTLLPNKVSDLTSGGNAGACLLLDSPSARAALSAMEGKAFYHTWDHERGVLQSFLLDAGSAEAKGKTACYSSFLVASLRLPADNERIVDIAYPNPDDVVNSQAQITGDDSLMLKYLNPHIAVVLSESQGDETAPEHTLYVSVVDTISGRLLHRLSHQQARACHTKTCKRSVTISENFVVYSYWNLKAKRTELGALSLYEGMIDRYALNPFQVPEQEGNFSSFRAKPPVKLKNTFIFPRAVSAITATVTARGITTKNILVATEVGQIAQIPRLALDPRRPEKKPSKNEQMERLQQYSPFLFPSALGMVTVNQTVLGLDNIYVAPATIESTCLVLGTGIDVYFRRTTPSQTFDLLSADFNRSMLIALVAGLAIAAYVAASFERKKRLSSAWQ